MLSGEVDTTRFDPVADAVRAQAMAQLTGNVLPGIRQQITQYNPGGSTRGDIIQAQAISSAQEDITNKIASAQFQAYKDAQDRRMGALGRYPSIMGAPLQQYDAMSAIGAQQRALDQAGIDEAMQRYSYESQLPTIGLQNYLAGISGDYGGTTTATGSSTGNDNIVPLDSIGLNEVGIRRPPIFMSLSIGSRSEFIPPENCVNSVPNTSNGKTPLVNVSNPEPNDSKTFPILPTAPVA